jgi:hypothetical protein
LEGSHLPVTLLPTRSPITPSPLRFQLVAKYLFMVDVAWRILHLRRRSPIARGRCAAGRTIFDPDLEQGGNTNIVVRRDSAN